MAPTIRLGSTVLCLVSAISVLAADLTKPYFAASKPGTWARTEMKVDGGGTSTYTYRRLPDEQGRVKIELDVAFLLGPSAGTWSKSTYIFERAFDPARDMLDYGRFTEKVVMEAAGMQPTVEPPEIVKAIREGGYAYKGTMTFKGSETVDGHACDRYSYTARSGGANPTSETGDLWLDATVPFGIVRQVAQGKDATGSFNAKYEMRLVASGTGTPPADSSVTAKGKGGVASPVGNGTLADAFQKGSVSLEVSVVEGSGGRRVSVTVTNTTDAPLTLELPEGETAIPAGLLLKTLRLVVGEHRTLQIPARAAAPPFDAEQAGERGATDGTFKIVREGSTVVFTGHSSIGKLPQ